MCSFFVSRAALSGILRNRCAVFFFRLRQAAAPQRGRETPAALGPGGLRAQVLSFEVAPRL